MHLQGPFAVFQRVHRRLDAARQLARLAHQRQPGAEPIRDGRGGHEPTRLDRHHHVNLVTCHVVGQRVDREAKRVGIGKQRSDVFEVDTGTWKVGDLRDVILQPAEVG